LSQADLFHWNDNGITGLPTVQEVIDFVGGDATRFTNGIGTALSREVLPIISNPARADSDGDGISDIYEHCKDYIADLISRGRLTEHAPNNIQDWLRVDNYEYHRGPLWRDTVESMYMGLLYLSDNQNRPNSEGWLLDMVSGDSAGRTRLRLEDNTITCRFNIYFNFSRFCNSDDDSKMCSTSGVRNCTCVDIDSPVSSYLSEERGTPRDGDEDERIRLYQLAEEYARATDTENVLSDEFKVNYDNITFAWLAAAGVMYCYTDSFTGTIYDFFPGMRITTHAEVNRADRARENGRHTAIDFQIWDRSGSSTGTSTTSIVAMRIRNSSSVNGFAITSAHEVAHLIGGGGLSDAYANSLDGHLNSRPRIANGGYRITGGTFEIDGTGSNSGFMRDPYRTTPNDFEMMLLVFVDNERQTYVPGGLYGQSRAIKSEVRYERRGYGRLIERADLRWVSRNCATDRRIGYFIPVDADIRQPYLDNDIWWDYFAEDGNAVILGIHSGDRTQSMVIPTHLGGLPVVGINNGAFWGETFTSVEIHNGITSIGINAFRDCTALTSVVFVGGGSLTAIDSRVFAGTTALRRIVLPNRITSIRTAAFRGSGLETITIPASVDRIVEGAFSDCFDLRSVVFAGSVPPLFGYNVFLNTEPHGIYVREGRVCNHITHNRANCTMEEHFVSIETAYRSRLPSRLNGHDPNLIFVIPFDDDGNPIGLCDICHLLEDDHCKCCDDCKKYQCECPCDHCGEYPCECPLCEDGCGQLERNCACPCGTCGKHRCICDRCSCGFQQCRCHCGVCGSIGLPCVNECCTSCEQIGGCVCEFCDHCEKRIFNGTITLECLCCNHCGKLNCAVDFRLGDIARNGEPDTESALAILRLLVGLSSIINNCDNAFRAALITGGEAPQVEGAIAILRFIVNLRSPMLDEIWGREYD
jgi:hypothetical protein